VRARDGRGDRDGLQTVEEVLDERASTYPDGALRAKGAVEQLAHGDDADGARLVAQQRIDVVDLARELEVDEHVGVD